MPRGEVQRRAREERWARYCELRDEGAEPWDAAEQVGLSEFRMYERAYLKLRGQGREPEPRESRHLIPKQHAFVWTPPG